jgi:thiol-disulfide isomerase/thioredoxin|tara:strand:+ start:121 stop:465 length:345 start_codon:yes stop_codon:yes gene_type:complete
MKFECKLILAYMLVFLLVGASQSYAQIQVIHFNASFNKHNDVSWFDKLGDCEKKSLTIDGNDNQKKYTIAVVPTIVVFDDGEEVKRFQADISFKMSATRKEVQDYIDELIISKF